MDRVDPDAPPDLSAVHSAPIRWVIERAVAGGNRVEVIAPWTAALVAHMRDGLSPALKEEVLAAWPGLCWFESPRSPHDHADEGFIDGGFAVSFPASIPAPDQASTS